MTVAELIEELQELPQHYNVVMAQHECLLNVEDVVIYATPLGYDEDIEVRK